ncbi:hypothetical protein K491DRAFT_425694 [Lophiostoma macrostomum CBS 122681]|uniref:Uncharacterized protein n=1 Tax=Lophiostoma macrostomum CBS 122681 TaxID=1314788 RepID=A0A6A6T673_9PLEO|nr:hypothetical protein K491DRAFT_425694 [Lophiostoma macrostomum CBS 122681]
MWHSLTVVHILEHARPMAGEAITGITFRVRCLLYILLLTYAISKALSIKADEARRHTHWKVFFDRNPNIGGSLLYPIPSRCLGLDLVHTSTEPRGTVRMRKCYASRAAFEIVQIIHVKYFATGR